MHVVPVLQLPDASELDEYDTDCTWAELAAKQSAGSFGVIDRATVEEGDCITMMDRNLFSQQFTRRVFVLFFDDYVCSCSTSMVSESMSRRTALLTGVNISVSFSTSGTSLTLSSRRNGATSKP